MSLDNSFFIFSKRKRFITNLLCNYITMIVCNTTKNDKNILIGDYSMEYTEGDCNN